MSHISDYTVLPVTLPRTASFPTTTTHTIYLRPHKPKIPTEDDSRSLFLVNVPVDSTSVHFRAIFTSLVGPGRFESVKFESDKKTTPSTTANSLPDAHKKPNKKRKRGEESAHPQEIELPKTWDRELHRSGSTAVVLFVDSKSVESVLKTIRKLHKSVAKDTAKWPTWGSGVEGKIPPLGSARYIMHHKLRYLDPAILQANVDEFMTAFNKAEEEKAQQAKRVRNVPDEDGFVTVTRGGRTGPAKKELVEERKREMEEKERKKREEMEKVGFYRFQVRERRKVEQGELVKRFEEDRERVRVLKERRGRFRPES